LNGIFLRNLHFELNLKYFVSFLSGLRGETKIFINSFLFSCVLSPKFKTHLPKFSTKQKLFVPGNFILPVPIFFLQQIQKFFPFEQTVWLCFASKTTKQKSKTFRLLLTKEVFSLEKKCL
jgi:hypothetical protein